MMILDILYLCVLYFQAISNADFWQIAGIAALERANPNLDLSFKGGRQDCSTSPDTSDFNTFPSASASGSEMFNWFESDFDMTPEEVCNLLYLHVNTSYPKSLEICSSVDINDSRCNNIQATALMGAHSLGRARRRNSGFNGLWTPGRTNRFDNEFYQLLIAPDIVYRNTVS